MVLFPKVILYLAVQMMAHLVQIVTPDRVSRWLPDSCLDMFNKTFGFSFRHWKGDLFATKLRLDGNTRQAR
jgi:hypothetical protein